MMDGVMLCRRTMRIVMFVVGLGMVVHGIGICYGEVTKEWGEANSTARQFISYNQSAVSGTQNNIPLQYYFNQDDIMPNGTDVITAYENHTQTPVEIEFYNSTTNNGSISYLGNTSEDGFWMYWGSGRETLPASDSTYGSEAVWDSNYKAVYHMLESGSTILDSTANDNDGTKYGSVLANGEYGKSQYFDSVNDYISIPDTLAGLSSFTIEKYIKPTSITGSSQYFGVRYTSIYDQMYIFSTGEAVFDFSSPTTRTVHQHTSTLVGGNYYFIALAWEPSSPMRMYVDGAGENDDVDTGGTPTAQAQNIGRSGFSMIGYYDEVRYSNIRRSNGVLETTHNNLNNPTSTGIAQFYNSTGDVEYYTDSLILGLNNSIESDGTITVNETVINGTDTNWLAGSGSTSYIEFDIFNLGGTILAEFIIKNDLVWINATGLSGYDNVSLYWTNDTFIQQNNTSVAGFVNYTNLLPGSYYITGNVTFDSEPEAIIFKLPETFILIFFVGLVVVEFKGWVILIAGLFYSMWFYSTQLDHTGTMSLFLTATFLLIGLSLFERIYEVKLKKS